MKVTQIRQNMQKRAKVNITRDAIEKRQQCIKICSGDEDDDCGSVKERTLISTAHVGSTAKSRREDCHGSVDALSRRRGLMRRGTQGRTGKPLLGGKVTSGK